MSISAMINDPQRLQNIKVEIDQLMDHMTEQQKYDFVQRWQNSPKASSIAENLQKKLQLAERIISQDPGIYKEIETIPKEEFTPDIQSVEYQNVFNPTTRSRITLGLGAAGIASLALGGGVLATLAIKNIFSKPEK